MNDSSNNSSSLLIKGNSLSSEKLIEKKAKLISNFKLYFEKFLDSFKEMNGILNSFPDKNLVLIEDINKTFSSFVREAENIETENSINFTNIERQLKRLSNYFSKLLISVHKNRDIVAIDNYTQDLYSTIRFLHDIINIEKRNLRDDEQSVSIAKEYQRLATEFSNRFPRYDGFKIEIKSYTNEFDIRIISSGQSSTARMIRESTNRIKHELEMFLEWELQKLDQPTAVTILASNGMITVEFGSDDEEEEEEWE